MLIKKKREVVVFLFMIFLFAGFVSADTCTLQTTCNQDNTILKLSSTTNAHGEVYDETNYNQYLCCDFTGTHTCDDSNKILGLSSPTNAHAESPLLDNYATDVCFGDLACTLGTDECLSGYTIQMLSLSAETNAHIGNFDDYSTKLCCKHRVPTFCGDEIKQTPNDDGIDEVCDGGDLAGQTCVSQGFDSGTLSCTSGCTEFDTSQCIKKAGYWENTNGDKITNITILPGTTEVKLVVDVTGLSQGTEVNFEIYEEDAISDDAIRTGEDALIGIVDANGNVEVSWIITQEDIDNAKGIGEGEEYKFYFKYEGERIDDNELIVSVLDENFCVINGISRCMHYNDEQTCEEDVCDVASESVPDEIVCGGSIVCSCNWDEDVCAPKWDLNQDVCSESDECWLAGDKCLDNCTCEEGYAPNGQGSCGKLSEPHCEADVDECWLAGDKCLDDCTCESGYYVNGLGWCSSDGSTNPPKIGTCYYNEDTDDDCADGFLTYSWIATWEWGEGNTFGDEKSGEEGYLEHLVGSGDWHYDPERKFEKCSDGFYKMICPAQVQLGFFGIYNMIVAFGLILFIYSILSLKKREK